VSDAKQLLDDLLADPHLRKQLAQALQEDSAAPRDWWRDRARPFIAGLSSAAVVMLAFLVPSLQDLWDRFETRRAVTRYAEIGRSLMAQHQFSAAEAAFDRALELGGTQRLELMALKIQAHVQRMEEDPEWPGAVPESLTESDFLYALAIDAGPEKVHERAAALGAYATFLAGAKRWPEAEQRLRQAIALDPRSADLHVWLGNLLGDRREWAAAELEYRDALALAPHHANAHYNLGLLLIETERAALAEGEFRAYLQQRPTEPQGYLRLSEALAAQGKSTEATAARDRARHLDPNSVLPSSDAPDPAAEPTT
jgi:tetratricopeptide (TPR) repeat protein